MTGAGLRDACGIPRPAWIDFCNGYAQAMFDTYHKPGEFICPSPDVSRADLAQEMYVGLVGRDNLADVNASRAAAQVLADLYPC